MRSENVRRATRRRQSMIATAIVSIAVLLVPLAVFAKPGDDGPKKVWVCHFAGHDAAEAWTGGGTTLDGDYVVAYVDGMPLANQVDYCESRGGHLILISVNALKGHGAQLQHRVADYPDGYKG